MRWLSTAKNLTPLNVSSSASHFRSEFFWFTGKALDKVSSDNSLQNFRWFAQVCSLFIQFVYGSNMYGRIEQIDFRDSSPELKLGNGPSLIGSLFGRCMSTFYSCAKFGHDRWLSQEHDGRHLAFWWVWTHMCWERYADGWPQMVRCFVEMQTCWYALTAFFNLGQGTFL